MRIGGPRLGLGPARPIGGQRLGSGPVRQIGGLCFASGRPNVGTRAVWGIKTSPSSLTTQRAVTPRVLPPIGWALRTATRPPHEGRTRNSSWLDLTTRAAAPGRPRKHGLMYSSTASLETRAPIVSTRMRSSGSRYRRATATALQTCGQGIRARTRHTHCTRLGRLPVSCRVGAGSSRRRTSGGWARGPSSGRCPPGSGCSRPGRRCRGRRSRGTRAGSSAGTGSRPAAGWVRARAMQQEHTHASAEGWDRRKETRAGPSSCACRPRTARRSTRA